MNKAILAIPVVVLSLTAHLAFAADAAAEKPKPDPLAAFKAADTNGDGGLSKDELAKTPAAEFKAIKLYFEDMDSNKDGKVTPAERDLWVTKQRYQNAR